MLHSFVFHHPDDWLRYIPLVELHYNSTYQAILGKSPAEVVFGRSPLLPMDMVDNQSPTFIRELTALWKEAKTAIVSPSKASKLGEPSLMRYYICSWSFFISAYKEPPHKSAGVAQVGAIVGWSLPGYPCYWYQCIRAGIARYLRVVTL